MDGGLHTVSEMRLPINKAERRRNRQKRMREEWWQETLAYHQRSKVCRMGVWTRFGMYEIGGYQVVR